MIDCIYDQAWPFYNGIAKVGFADRFSRLSYIYINKNGSALTQATYQSAQSFYNSSAVVRINWKEGFINDRGELFISAIYEFANPFSEDIAAVELAKNNWTFINNKGNIISQLEHGINIFKRYRYDEFNRWNLSCFSEGLIVVEKHDKYGFANAAGDLVILAIYDKVSGFSEGLAVVRACLGIVFGSSGYPLQH